MKYKILIILFLGSQSLAASSEEKENKSFSKPLKVLCAEEVAKGASDSSSSLRSQGIFYIIRSVEGVLTTNISDFIKLSEEKVKLISSGEIITIVYLEVLKDFTQTLYMNLPGERIYAPNDKFFPKHIEKDTTVAIDSSK